MFFFPLSEFLQSTAIGRTRSLDRCWAAIRLSHHPGLSGHAVHGEVDGLDIGGQQGRRSALLRHTSHNQAIKKYWCSLMIFGILSWRMQEVRKSQNHDLKADLAWSINSGKMESRLRHLPGLRRLRATARSSGLKRLKILYPWGRRIFQKLDRFLLTSLVDSRLPVLVLTRLPAIVCPVLTELWDDGVFRDGAQQASGASRPASEFIHGAPPLAARVWEVMDLTASSHRSCFFCSSRKSRDEASP